jgi:hypothetical protein
LLQTEGNKENQDRCLKSFVTFVSFCPTSNDISAAGATEMYLALWIRLWGKLGTPLFNIHILRA